MNLFEIIWQTLILTAICYASIFMKEKFGAPIFASIPAMIFFVMIIFSSLNGRNKNEDRKRGGWFHY